MLYRENGQFKTSYRADAALFPVAQDRWAMLALAAVAFLLVPLLASDYSLRAVLIPFLILALAAIGLNILVGYCGQISLGTGAFMAVGAYAAFNLDVRFTGMPPLLSILGGGLAATLVGVAFGLPSLRIRGLYLAVATLAAQFFIDWFANRVFVGHQRLVERLGQRTRSADVRHRDRQPRRSLSAVSGDGGAVRGAGQKPGARRTRPRMDGDPRHGRGRRGDRHPPRSTPS